MASLRQSRGDSAHDVPWPERATPMATLTSREGRRKKIWKRSPARTRKGRQGRVRGPDPTLGGAPGDESGPRQAGQEPGDKGWNTAAGKSRAGAATKSQTTPMFRLGVGGVLLLCAQRRGGWSKAPRSTARSKNEPFQSLYSYQRGHCLAADTNTIVFSPLWPYITGCCHTD